MHPTACSPQLQAPWLRLHWNASIRLLQLVHFLADYIPDWDLVVHALEQISCIIVSISSTAAPSLPSSVSHEYPSSINALNASQKQSSSSRFERTLSGLVLEGDSLTFVNYSTHYEFSHLCQSLYLL